MAVVGFPAEIATGRGATEAEDGSREYTRVYLVRTDNVRDSAKTVLEAPLLPFRGQTYATATETDVEAKVIERTPRPLDKTMLAWHVEVRYSTKPQNKDDPTVEPPEITFDFETYQEPLPGAFNQQKGPYGETVKTYSSGIVNSAGEPYDPPAERERSRPIVRFKRNEPGFALATAVRYINTVNQLPWSGLYSRQAMLRGIRATSAVWRSPAAGNAETRYYQVEYVFAIRYEGWILELLDCGLHYLKYKVPAGTGYNRLPFLVEGSGEPRIGLLDNRDAATKGKALDVTTTPPPDPCWNQFKIYKEEDFAPLGINLDLSLSQQKKPR